jgi:hypothetical protein
MTLPTVNRPGPRRTGKVPERVTPRIDSTARCRCGTDLIFDEVFGWLHTATSQAILDALPAHVPAPATGTDPARSS